MNPYLVGEPRSEMLGYLGVAPVYDVCLSAESRGTSGKAGRSWE